MDLLMLASIALHLLGAVLAMAEAEKECCCPSSAWSTQLLMSTAPH